MNEIKEIITPATRLRELAQRRTEILSMPPENARNAILESPQPAALVHSIREEDFYFLIHDIGVEDALELLGLASDRQWDFILDMGMWEKDRISMPDWTRWLNRLMKADPHRLVRWISEERAADFEYYLYRNIQLAVREHDQDPSDFGEGFHTYDDTLYVKFGKTLYDPERKPDAIEERDAFLDEFLFRLAADDHILYYNLLVESQAVIPAEYEEEAYRLRNIRMDEKGFKPFEEAVGIYQPLSTDNFFRGRQKRYPVRSLSGEGDAPFYPFNIMAPDSLFARGLEFLGDWQWHASLRNEFAGLCNRIVSADRQPVEEREALRSVVKKVCGYVSIGIAALTDRNDPSPGRAAMLIRQYPMEDIFRVGYGKALDLKWRAERWRKESWAEEHGLPLSFWGEAWLGVIGGLLIRRPLFFDNYRTGVLYREFHTMADITATRKVLDQVIALDELFGLMDGVAFRFPRRMLTWQQLLLTLWARWSTGYDGDRLAVPLSTFIPFYRELWEGSLPSRRISDAARERFLKWLAHAARLDAYVLSSKFRETLEALFDAVENEYQAVSEVHLDPRHIHLFMLT